LEYVGREAHDYNRKAKASSRSMENLSPLSNPKSFDSRYANPDFIPEIRYETERQSQNLTQFYLI